jgi:hypothetical protein
MNIVWYSVSDVCLNNIWKTRADSPIEEKFQVFKCKKYELIFFTQTGASSWFYYKKCITMYGHMNVKYGLCCPEYCGVIVVAPYLLLYILFLPFWMFGTFDKRRHLKTFQPLFKLLFKFSKHEIYFSNIFKILIYFS